MQGLRRLALVLIVAALAGFAPAVPAGAAPTAPAAPGIGIRLLQAPADRVDDPRARSYVIDHVAPGRVIERAIEVSNTTGGPARLELYPGPAHVDGGEFVVGDRDQRNELTSWARVSPAAVTLDHGERARVVATIEVPADAAAAEHYGAVWAELRGTAEQGMAVASRVGIRIYLSVGPGGEPRTDFAVESFTASRSPEGRPAVDIRACNTGGRAVDLVGTVMLEGGPGGTSVGPVASMRAATLAPAQCGPVKVWLDDGLPAGPWQATAAVRSGVTERQASGTITFPMHGDAPAAPAEAKEPGGTWRWIAAGLALLALAVYLLRGGWDRWRRPPLGHPRPQPDRAGHAVAPRTGRRQPVAAGREGGGHR